MLTSDNLACRRNELGAEIAAPGAYSKLLFRQAALWMGATYLQVS